MDEMTALAILTNLLESSLGKDMPAAEVFTALNYLAARLPVKWPFVLFGKHWVAMMKQFAGQSIESAARTIKLLLMVQHR
jgi:hypothetical protein